MATSATPKTFSFKTRETLANGNTAPHVTVAPSPIKAVLAIVLNHTAEVFHGVVDAIADHYKLDKTEMMTVITSHPAFTKVILSPVLNDLGTFEEKGSVETPTPAPKRQWSEEAKARAAAKRAEKRVVATEPIESPVTTQEEEPKPATKKKVFIFKKASDTGSTASSS